MAGNSKGVIFGASLSMTVSCQRAYHDDVLIQSLQYYSLVANWQTFLSVRQCHEQRQHKTKTSKAFDFKLSLDAKLAL